MNPIPSNNKAPTSRGEVSRHWAWDFGVDFPEIAFAAYSEWMDDEVVKLEAHFNGFVTERSQKRSFGR